MFIISKPQIILYLLEFIYIHIDICNIIYYDIKPNINFYKKDSDCTLSIFKIPTNDPTCSDILKYRRY